MRAANPHFKIADSQSAEEMRAALEKFIAQAALPAALDEGEEPLPLRTGTYSLEAKGARVSVEAWDENRSLSRRVVSIDQAKSGMLLCTVERFGGARGKFRLIDLARPQTATRIVQAARQSFVAQFRKMLQRQLPTWEVKSASAALDLRRSFSAIFPRAHLQKGMEHIAALACPEAAAELELMTSALLWFDFLRQRLKRGERLSLCLFLPETAGAWTAQRLKWLTAWPLHTQVFRFNEQGMAGGVDVCDLGNVETHVVTRRGLLESGAPATRFPEAQMEWIVRRNVEAIDAGLETEPVHSQVLTFAAGAREAIDLLAISRAGQLSIIELKASEDMQLPMQALDYWSRVLWHLERGELDALFPGREIQRERPNLLLVAPAFSFHPANEIVLRYFSREISVQRIGVNSEWESGLRVVLRLAGAEQPISHRSTQRGRNDTRRISQYQESDGDTEPA